MTIEEKEEKEIRVNQIRAGLRPLFEQATKNKLFFFNIYKNLLMSPRQLREEQSKGNCLWDASQWSLKDPKDYIAGLKKEVAIKQAIIKDYES